MSDFPDGKSRLYRRTSDVNQVVGWEGHFKRVSFRLGHGRGAHYEMLAAVNDGHSWMDCDLLPDGAIPFGANLKTVHINLTQSAHLFNKVRCIKRRWDSDSDSEVELAKGLVARSPKRLHTAPEGAFFMPSSSGNIGAEPHRRDNGLEREGQETNSNITSSSSSSSSTSSGNHNQLAGSFQGVLGDLYTYLVEERGFKVGSADGHHRAGTTGTNPNSVPQPQRKAGWRGKKRRACHTTGTNLYNNKKIKKEKS